MTTGYHDDVAANDAARVGAGWLDTGDLGFMHAGELASEWVVTGRAKEIIFVNARNHYPQDLEALAQAVDGVEANKVAAADVRASGGDADELVFSWCFAAIWRISCPWRARSAR